MTLIELLITMAIMAIISAAILGTASAAMEAARRDRTQTLVTKISGLVNERLATYETRRVDLQGSVLAAVNALPNPRDRGMAMAEMRLLAQREAMKFEMPETWNDFLPLPVILSNKPSLAQQYMRKYTALKTLKATNPTDQYQGAECLYMTVMGATGDGEARTLFSKQDIGDVDNDGMPEFLDGWGQPISWLRWPAGVISDLQPTDPATGGRFGDADHDPLDMYRRDHVTAAHVALSGLSTPAQNEYAALVNRNTSGNVYATAYRLVPLVYSAGPDGSSDILTGQRIIVNSSLEKITTLDPYSPTATAGLQVGGHTTTKATATTPKTTSTTTSTSTNRSYQRTRNTATSPDQVRQDEADPRRRAWSGLPRSQRSNSAIDASRDPKHTKPMSQQNYECGMLNAESSAKRRAAPLPPAFSIQPSAFPPSAFPPPPSPLPLRPLRGLTLIELLVTIVIMVTVLAGVIPLMSPNNNSRKIREASRQLNSLLAQAQAQAARDGRPAGVAFRELVTGAPGSATYNGIAIEAFMIAEPAPFAGFSEWSRAQLHTASSTPGAAVDGIQFVTAPTLAADPLPPMTIRRNDVVEIGKHRFRITDPDRDGDGTPDDTAVPPFLPGDFYTRDGSGASHHVFICAPETSNAPVLNVDSSSLTTPRTYVIRRQPANTSDAPLQFPRGIGIDLQASGATGPDGPNTFDAPGAVDLIGIMFNPDGTLAGLHYVDKLERIQQIFLLLGLVENANNGSQDPNDYDFKNFGILDRDNLAQRRSRINWLNADSRWVTVNRAGRVLTSTNNLFDPSLPAFTDNLDTSSSAPPEHVQQRNRQIAAARDFAARMQQEGGR